MTPQPRPAILVIGTEPILHGLLSRHLAAQFSVTGEPGGTADAIEAARLTNASALCLDADLRADPDGSDAARLVATLRLLTGAPIVALSADAPPGSARAAALLRSGAETVLHKQAGRLPPNLGQGLGDRLVTALLQAAEA